MYPTGLLRILNFKLSDRATPDKIALAEGGTVLFETRSFVSLSFTVRACKFVDLLQCKQFRKELSFNFREKLLNRSTNLNPRTVNLRLTNERVSNSTVPPSASAILSGVARSLSLKFKPFKCRLNQPGRTRRHSAKGMRVVSYNISIFKHSLDP